MSENDDENNEVQYPYEFDEDKRKKAELYSKQKFYTGIFQGVVLYLLFLSLIYFTEFSYHLEFWIEGLASGTALANRWVISALFVLIFSSLLYIISLPVSYYSGFVLEHRYDLSNESLGEWAKDQVKSFSISLIFMVPIILGLFFLGYTFPKVWWLYAGILLFAISGILSNISHLVILPLFYDLEELEDEELTERLVEMAEEHGVAKLEKVVVVKAGEKTEKANAGFAGMGKTKRLLLFDTLLEKFHPNEIESVVAHEMGHYVNKDTIRFMAISALLIFPIFYLTSLIFTHYASFENIYHLPLFLLILYGLYSVIDPVTNAYSRRREKSADDFANSTVNDPEATISAFKRLSDIDLAETDPSRIVEIFFYSHPPPKKRIERTKTYSKKEKMNKNDK
ncbi:MAG: M48 family metallopeptidase [Candidatus Thermoplasmatota archaeon]